MAQVQTRHFLHIFFIGFKSFQRKKVLKLDPSRLHTYYKKPNRHFFGNFRRFFEKLKSIISIVYETGLIISTILGKSVYF